MYVFAVESCHLGFIVALSVTSSRSVSCPDSLCWLLALPFFLNLPSPLDAPSTLSSPPDPRFHYLVLSRSRLKKSKNLVPNGLHVDHLTCRPLGRTL